MLNGVVLDVRHLDRVVADGSPLIGARQKAGMPVPGPAVVVGGLDFNVTGQVLVLGSQAVKDPGTHAGQGEVERSGVELEQGRPMVHALAHHGANHAELVGVGSHLSKEIADRNAALTVAAEGEGRLHESAQILGSELERQLEGDGFAVVLLQPGLGVEGVDLGRAAVHEHEDDPLGPGAEVGKLGSERVVRRGAGQQAAVLRQQSLQSQGSESAGRSAQHRPPGNGSGWEIHGSLS